MSISASDLLRYYDASYPPDILVPPAPPVVPSLLLITPSSIVINTPTPCTLTGTFARGDKVFVDGIQQVTDDAYVPSNLTYTALADTMGDQTVDVRNSAGTSATKTMTVTATQEEPLP